MKCGWATPRCKEKATHYVSVIIDDKGTTRHIDDYYCDNHTGVSETTLSDHPDVIEFEAKELKK